MKIVEPSVEIIDELNVLKRIELCGRVCYKSEDKITETSALNFVRNIKRRGHTSVLEHARIALSIDETKYLCEHCDSVAWKSRVKWYGLHSTINVRDFLLVFPEATIEDAAAHPPAHDLITVRFVCDRAIANELVRHRVFSFSQESTRYVSYREGVTFIRPVPFEWATDESSPLFGQWHFALTAAETAYRTMICNGATPEQARSVLPLSTKTELVMSGLMEQWWNMLRLRFDAAHAHPQMYHLMKMLVEKKPALIQPPF